MSEQDIISFVVIGIGSISQWGLVALLFYNISYILLNPSRLIWLLIALVARKQKEKIEKRMKEMKKKDSQGIFLTKNAEEQREKMKELFI